MENFSTTTIILHAIFELSHNESTASESDRRQSGKRQLQAHEYI